MGLARWAKVPAGVIGATVAAFATSSPELTVAINASRAGSPEIAFGDALGSNVVNVGLILGMALLFGPITAARSSIRLNYSAAVLAPLATAAMIFDGKLSRAEAGLLLVVFVACLVFEIRGALRERSAAPEVLSDSPRWSCCGLILLIAAGGFIVDDPHQQVARSR